MVRKGCFAMKLLFCNDLLANKENKAQSDDKFIVLRASEEQIRRVDEAKNKLSDAKRASMPSLLMRLLYGLAHVPILILLILILAVGRSDSVNYGNSELLTERLPILLPLCAFCIIYMLFFRWYKRRKLYSANVLEVIERAETELNSARREVFDLFSIPKEVNCIDILRTDYLVRPDGFLKMSQHCNNFEAWLYSDNKAMYVMDGNALYAIPREAMSGISRSDIGAVRLDHWNKPEPINNSKYVDHMQQNDKSMRLILLNVYALSFSSDGEEYRLLFPGYELRKIEELTGLSVK